MDKPIILIVEDEPKLAQLIIDYLKDAEFDAVWFPSGTAAVKYLSDHQPALIVLDIMLPDKNGFEICREMRNFSSIPIVMLTARGQEEDRLKGFDLGADDYICKPFSPKELISRIKAILKRVAPINDGSNADKPILNVQADAYKATLNDVLLDLTPQEFRIILALSSQVGRVFTRAELIEKAYANDSGSNDRAIDSHVKNLRKKIKDVDGQADILKSIYGVGYKLEY